jgi:methylated-DNA-[protein]-cysteine S-methyltransferase
MPIKTPLGTMTLLAHEHGLCGAWFEQQTRAPVLDQTPWGPDQPWLLAAKHQLLDYFSGRQTTFNIPLRPLGGTPFQQQVWQALRLIPFGRYCSYKDIAAYLGKPEAARAVGMAVGRNPLSIFLPCHRVVGQQRALTGYAGGIERKIALLSLEGVLLH